MSLLRVRPPSTTLQRRQQSTADKSATVCIAVGFALTLAAILGLPGPNAWFMGLAPAIAIVTGFPCLLALMMERHRGGIARLLLLVGAVALAAAGFAYLHDANGARVLLAYFAPAVLFAGAAWILAAPRLSARTS